MSPVSYQTARRQFKHSRCPLRQRRQTNRDKTHLLPLGVLAVRSNAPGPLQTEKLSLLQLFGLFAQGFDLGFQIGDLLVELGDLALQGLGLCFGGFAGVIGFFG